MTTDASQTLRSAREVVEAGLAPRETLSSLDAVAARYAVAITPAMADLIEPGVPDDPIARQFVPDEAELRGAPEEIADPIGDDAHSPVPGIVHRYPDRVLFKPLHVCPVYCRFCFRREMVGPTGQGSLSAEETEAALGYIRGTPAIWEVVITGGDPLILSPRRLRDITERLCAIDHVQVVRFHSRVPVVAPDRVTDELVAALRPDPGKAVYVVLHANHPRELTPEARAACARLVDAGVPMLSQSVLLRGINDRPEVLEALMRGLVETRIKPYYLHHPDLAPGTGHFRLPISEGQALVRALRGRVSGLCQPTYVLDLPNGHGKSPIGPDYAKPLPGEPGRYRVEDYTGRVHVYPPGDGLARD
ncbi:lysine-2,3-aminomutase-like protein [Rubellimicrobium rubrum]|uniref:Lysine-2,3-aminomutase-like protein n=1 Tax=Rubellimicrobium rubrum TaxID=2585369 RepID=A0A5C4MRB0_9RHOB|nr:lysine-2,3-aminomutase-like protein [Rubellimicrobium rubrum]TNC47003.1 lysine-2,3-aminomutase-like protein [Rubellimicrobium rubrum]